MAPLRSSTSIDRLVEEAADELARLDTICQLAPASVARALWLAAVSSLAGPAQQGVKELAIAAADPASASGDPAGERLALWEQFLTEEQRRVRGGAPLTLARLDRATTLGLADAHVARRAHVASTKAVASSHTTERGSAHTMERGSQHTTERGSAFLRSSALAAEVADRAVADAAAALVLCAEGRMDVVRLLPFRSIGSEDRERALAAWRAGDPEPWQAISLHAAASAARQLRRTIEAHLRDMNAEDVALDRMGRAAITARRALDHLREGLATTVGTLASSLRLSFPAASDALRRLEASGLATELTGRRRGRVYAYTAALRVAGGSSS